MPPPLPPRPLGFPLVVGTVGAAAPHTAVDLFLDVCCPFSVKQFRTIYHELAPRGRELPGGVVFRFHGVPQPWHPQSAVMHEACQALGALRPELFWPYAGRVMGALAAQFQDPQVYDKSKAQLHRELAALAVAVPGAGEGVEKEILDLLQSESGQKDVIQAIKWAVKYHRVRGVHVTPTVFINDTEAPDISSSFTCEEWIEKLRSL